MSMETGDGSEGPTPPSPPALPPNQPSASVPPPKQVDEVYCQSCGTIIKKEAEICMNCGVRVRRAASQAAGKSKVVAILLAVFLGFWTWLYTYRVDGWKFWLGLGVSIVTLGIASLGFWVWAIVDSVTKSEEWYLTYD